MALHFTRTMDNSKKLKVRILYLIIKNDRAENNFIDKISSLSHRHARLKAPIFKKNLTG